MPNSLRARGPRPAAQAKEIQARLPGSGGFTGKHGSCTPTFPDFDVGSPVYSMFALGQWPGLFVAMKSLARHSPQHQPDLRFLGLVLLGPRG